MWRLTKHILAEREDGSMSWESFLKVFRENYFPESIWEQKEVEFLELLMGAVR